MKLKSSEHGWEWDDAAVNNQARIDALTSDAAAVTLLSEPKTNTTVIWVSDEGPER